MRCHVCDCNRLTKYITKSFEDISSTWMECGECGTLFISPLPSQEEILNYYATDYVNKKSPGFVSHQSRFSEENKKTIFNEYLLSLTDIGIQIETLRNKQILDYGCANGLFLDLLAFNGCFKKDLFGFDIACDLLQKVVDKGYQVMADKLNGDFDYIFLWDVLEHAANPNEILSFLKSCLRGGGKIVAQTPRVGHITHSLKDKWEHFLPFEHVTLYTRESLIRLFDNEGFKLLSVASFGANAPSNIISQPYKNVFDGLAKLTDNGSTQIASFVK